MWCRKRLKKWKRLPPSWGISQKYSSRLGLLLTELHPHEARLITEISVDLSVTFVLLHLVLFIWPSLVITHYISKWDSNLKANPRETISSYRTPAASTTELTSKSKERGGLISKAKSTDSNNTCIGKISKLSVLDTALMTTKVLKNPTASFVLTWQNLMVCWGSRINSFETGRLTWTKWFPGRLISNCSKNRIMFSGNRSNHSKSEQKNILKSGKTWRRRFHRWRHSWPTPKRTIFWSMHNFKNWKIGWETST